MKWCSECAAVHAIGAHYLKFEVWSVEETREAATVIPAQSIAEAVQRWAQLQDDKGDYAIVKGAHETVHVARQGNDITACTMIVTGEMVAEYTTRLVFNEDEAGP